MKRIPILLFALTATSTSYAWGNKQSIAPKNSISYCYSYNVSFVHFIDGLSQWSPYVPNSARVLYDQYFTMTHEDSTMLNIYKANRDRLGWDNETNLFRWAANDYRLDRLPSFKRLKEQQADTAFAHLKACIDYFSRKKSPTHDLNSILHQRYDKLQEIVPLFDRYAKEISTTLQNHSSIYKMWYGNNSINISTIPLFLCFNHIPTSMQGGSNGDGVYSEISIEDGKDSLALKESAIMLVHELLHKMIDSKKLVTSIITSPKFYKSNIDFFKKNNLTQEMLLQKFSTSDKEGMGNSEISVFEEVVVYYLSTAYLGGYNEEKILEKIRKVSKNRLKEFNRIWYGVLLLNREYQKNNTIEDKNAFIANFIKIYYENIYFENYKQASI